jgi:hypothetical protein
MNGCALGGWITIPHVWHTTGPLTAVGTGFPQRGQ